VDLSVLYLFLSTFSIVFFIGIQIKCVNGNHFLLAAITSMGVSVANLFAIRLIPSQDLWSWGLLAYVSGGPCGITLSMWMHNKLVKGKR
jgi:hypothetical protein